MFFPTFLISIVIALFPLPIPLFIIRRHSLLGLVLVPYQFHIPEQVEVPLGVSDVFILLGIPPFPLPRSGNSQKVAVAPKEEV